MYHFNCSGWVRVEYKKRGWNLGVQYVFEFPDIFQRPPGLLKILFATGRTLAGN